MNGLKAEFKKITFPKHKDVAKQTAVIIATVIVLGCIIKLLDTGLGVLISAFVK